MDSKKEEFTLKKIPMIPLNFIKKTIQTSDSEKNLFSKLNDFAKNQDFDLDIIKYFFTKELLKQNFFFTINEEIREALLYDAIYWASLMESRIKTRPKNFKEIKDGRKNPLFVQLQKEVIKSIYKNFDSTSMSFDIKLEYHLSFFFELYSIKRNRKCSDDV